LNGQDSEKEVDIKLKQRLTILHVCIKIGKRDFD